MSSSTSRKVEGLCLLRYRINYNKLSYSLQLKILLAALFFLSITQKTDGQCEDRYRCWCISDEQYPDSELQKGLDWACRNGADCTKIQTDQPCYLPNTIKDHASYVFNSYYQSFKHTGGDCYFNGAALLTPHDPSHDTCKFELLP